MSSAARSSLYDLEIQRSIQEIKSRKSKKIILQFPDGLMSYAVNVASQISEETGAQAVISLDTCYGACDLSTYAAMRLKADLVIHYGHAPWRARTPIPTIYVEAFVSTDVVAILDEAIKLLGGVRTIGLVSVVQHLREMNRVIDYFESHGLKVLVGNAGGRVKYDGQVLGCDYTSARSIANRVEKFVFIGGGKFHIIGLALATRKECIAVDPFSSQVFSSKEMLAGYLKSRYGCIMEAKAANSFGVIIGLKFGQLDLHNAFRVKDMLTKFGKRVTLFCADDLRPERLASIGDIDVFVVTACPRIAIDDYSSYKKPVLTSEEAEMIFSEELVDKYLGSA